MRRVFACFIFVGALAIVPGCSGGERYTGTVSVTAESNPATPERWVVTVRLDSASVVGAVVVQVGFDIDQLACEDGSAAEPKSVRPGQMIRFTPEEGPVSSMDPPVIGGTDLEITCG